jgi:hypothetical protein
MLFTYIHIDMKHNFRPYINPVFIETGSYCGEGIQAAINAGFKSIISIELSEYYYNICKDIFKGYKQVHLVFGDSTEELPKILKKIDSRCTFWLDGHWCGDKSACGANPVPLMDELLAIKDHHIKDHTILIDDMRLLRDKDAEWKDLKYTTADIENLIRSINSKYIIYYDKGVTIDDILIAHI